MGEEMDSIGACSLDTHDSLLHLRLPLSTSHLRRIDIESQLKLQSSWHVKSSLNHPYAFSARAGRPLPLRQGRRLLRKPNGCVLVHASRLAFLRFSRTVPPVTLLRRELHAPVQQA